MSAAAVWLEFSAALVLITLAGSRLARYGDVIATRTGLGGSWVGLILVATVTSLPELITGISAVVLVVAPDIAVGQLLGSCVFNLLIIVVLDFMVRGKSVYARVGQDHVLSASFGILLVGVVGFSILLAERGRGVAIGHVGISTPLILLIYALAVRSVFRFQRRYAAAARELVSPLAPDLSLSQAVFGYALAALVVVGAGMWLPFVGERMSVQLGVSQTFVGSLFVALATSLPEVVVTVAAMRLGAFNMAMSNLFGSNLFNILVLVPADLLYLDGPILAAVSPIHAFSAISAMSMTGIAVVGLVYHPMRRMFRAVAWASLILLSIYLLNFYVLYLYSA